MNECHFASVTKLKSKVWKSIDGIMVLQYIASKNLIPTILAGFAVFIVDIRLRRLQPKLESLREKQRLMADEGGVSSKVQDITPGLV